jgi:beta-galactosidase
LPKPAAHIYRSQEAQEPYLQMLHSVDIGDYNVGYVGPFYIATNCEYVDVYQNDRLVSRCYPNKELFPQLKHPPIVLDDLFGDAFMQEGIDEVEAAELKQLAHLAASRGGLDKITKYDNVDWDKLHKAWNLYGKYVANWGSKTFTYTLKGTYQNQEIVKQVGPYQTYHYDIQSSTTTLFHEDTYDVAKITIQAIDDLGNLRPYAFDAFTIEATGSISLIGEPYVSLIGGKRAIWIRSTGLGKGTLKVNNHQIHHTIEFDVIQSK